jgi:hypothetical protein
MKASKTELIRLARLVQKDTASGRVSKNAQQAVEILLDYQNSAIELLDLALEEASEGRSNESLVDSLGFLFGQSLEALRFDIESGYRTASELAANIRKRLLAEIKAGASDPSILLFLAQCFGTAKLDLGEELRAAVGQLLQQGGKAHAGDSSPAELADILGFVTDLSQQADGDPFALYSVLAESSDGVPDEHRAVMATALLFSGEAAAAEAAVGWLLDPARSVRHALANALEGAARTGKVTPTMLRRMITMRNWLPEDSRVALDAAISTARRNGLSPAQWDDVEARQLTCTGVDGSGAIGILAYCRSKRKNVFGSLVLKHGFGVRDAWAREGMTTKEIKQTFFEASLMDQFVIPRDFIRTGVGHFLAVGHQTGLMAPFGLLQFLEAVGVSSVQPELTSAASLLDTISDVCAISDCAFEDLLAEGFDLVDDYEFMDSWFEVGDEVDAALTGSRASRKKREALVIEKVLEPRREWWIQQVAWAAHILHQSGDERWREFYAAARAMVQQRPLPEISLMKRVAEQTIIVSETRQMAA